MLLYRWKICSKDKWKHRNAPFLQDEAIDNIPVHAGARGQEQIGRVCERGEVCERKTKWGAFSVNWGRSVKILN